MSPKDPFFEGTFWDKFWRPIRSRALLFTPASSRTQLQEIIPQETLKNFLQLQLHDLMVFELEMQWFRKEW